MSEQDDKIGLPGARKLTEWPKEPSVMDLKGDLEASKPSHDTHVQNVRRWTDLRNVTGKAKPKAQKNRSQVQPKLIRRQAEWRYSALSEPFLSSDKLFNVDPRTHEDGNAAKQNETLLNWQFDTKIDKVHFIDEYVRTAVDEGTVIVRLGWFRDTKTRKVKVPVFAYGEIASPEELTELEQAIGLAAQNPRMFAELPVEMQAAVEYFKETGNPTVVLITGYEDAEEEEILENKPTLDILDVDNVYIDPSCNGDLDKANFVIVSFESSKAELLKDGRYKNLESVNWSGAEILGQPDHKTETPADFNFRDELRKRVVVHEYWGSYDVEGTEELKPIVASWIGDTMVRMEENPFPDGKPPFVVVPYLPVRKQLMGEPDAELLEDNQAILGALIRGMIDLMGRSANSQQGIAKGFLDAVNRRRYENGQDYEFNPVNGGPQQSIHAHQYPEIPNSAITMINLMNHEAESISGVKAFHGGMSGEAYGEVATAIKGMLDAAAKREMNILRRLAKGIKQIGSKIAAMNAVFLTEEEVVRVTNKEFVTVRREDLKGNFDLKVDISTAEVDEAKAQDLGFMLQTMGPDMDPAMVRMILAEIAELKRMPVLAQMIRDYQPQPDPLQEKLKELEIAKLEAEIQEIRSKAMKNQASAAKDASEADLKDLEYIEEESGTKHAREMERQGEQARANQDLEVTKALLKGRKKEESPPNIEAAIGYGELTDPTRTVRGL